MPSTPFICPRVGPRFVEFKKWRLHSLLSSEFMLTDKLPLIMNPHRSPANDVLTGPAITYSNTLCYNKTEKLSVGNA